MKRITSIATALLLISCTSWAQGQDIEEVEVESVNVEEVEVKYPQTGERVKEVEVKVDKSVRIAPSYYRMRREGRFRVGLIGPGIYYGNKNIDAMMSFGAEGEYFIFEQFSVGLRAQVATDFKSDANPNAIVSFIPQVRYVFDLDGHPRWSIYIQAGVGMALIDGDNLAADIAIPGGGFWWQWNEHLSIGAEASLHVLARSNTAVAVQFGPALRYQF